MAHSKLRTQGRTAACTIVLQIYDDKSMAAAEYSLARKTCMTEYTVKAYEGVHGEGAPVPQGELGAGPLRHPGRGVQSSLAELVERETAIGNEYRRRLEAAAPILDVIDDGEGRPSATYNDLRRDGNFTPEFLFESNGITPDIVEALYDFAKYRYDCGEYAEAAFYLGACRRCPAPRCCCRPSAPRPPPPPVQACTGTWALRARSASCRRRGGGWAASSSPWPGRTRTR